MAVFPRSAIMLRRGLNLSRHMLCQVLHHGHLVPHVHYSDLYTTPHLVLGGFCSPNLDSVSFYPLY